MPDATETRTDASTTVVLPVPVKKALKALAEDATGRRSSRGSIYSEKDLTTESGMRRMAQDREMTAPAKTAGGRESRSVRRSPAGGLNHRAEVHGFKNRVQKPHHDGRNAHPGNRVPAEGGRNRQNQKPLKRTHQI